MQQPTRSLPLQGASNFRDLGGYATQDGRRVRWRRLFRSDHLGALTPDDVRLLSGPQGLGIGRVFDFRGAQERLAAPCAVPGVQVHALSIEPTIVQRMSDLIAAGQVPTEPEMVGLMQQTYRDFVRHNTPRFATLFAHLLASDQPLVFHCTAGKDRTGFAAAMILRSLGVPHPVMMEDYLLTNALLRVPANVGGVLPEEARLVLFRVQQDFLNAALEVVEKEYGGQEAYLTDALGLRQAERARLAALYLEP